MKNSHPGNRVPPPALRKFGRVCRLCEGCVLKNLKVKSGDMANRAAASHLPRG